MLLLVVVSWSVWLSDSDIVDDGHVIITIPFRSSKCADFPIKFVIDTGFTDELCLPPEAVALLNLPFKHDIRVNLADNSRVILPVHKAIILWYGEEREARVFATGLRPIVELLY